MRGRLALLLTSTAIGLAGGVATAATASAEPDAHSQHGQCISAAAGLHVGWSEQADGGRNIGGACPRTP